MRCQTCQLNAPNKQKEPLIQHEIPNEPFKRVACDILEHWAKSYLVVIDFYSKIGKRGRRFKITHGISNNSS